MLGSVVLVDELGLTWLLFPYEASSSENRCIRVSAVGSGKPFLALATNLIPNYYLASNYRAAFPSPLLPGLKPLHLPPTTPG